MDCGALIRRELLMIRISAPASPEEIILAREGEILEATRERYFLAFSFW